MTVSVTASLSSLAPPTVLVDVSSSPSVTAPLVVYRVHDDGTRHPVLTSGLSVLVGTWSGYDYHAPLNRMFHYVAAAEGQVESAASADVYVPSESFWLVSPSDPALSVSVEVVVSLGARKRASSATTYKVLGSTKPVVRSDFKRMADTGDVTILADDDDAVLAVEALLEDDGPVLLNSHRSERVRWTWVQPGDLTIAPAGDSYRSDMRLCSFPWVSCRAPDVDVVNAWDFSTLADDFASFSAATAAFADFRAMQLNIRS